VAGGRAQPPFQELSERFAKNTLVQGVWLPTAQAALALERGDSNSVIRSLDAARPYEAGEDIDFWPQYVRALLFMRAKLAAQASAEFQNILDHRGYAPLSVVYPLARLGLAPAAILVNDTKKAQTEYEAFFSIWKNADPNLPVLQAARREYAKLQAARMGK